MSEMANVLAAMEAWYDAKAAFEHALEKAGLSWTEKWWADDYDSSAEFKFVGNEVRLSDDQQRIIYDAGFRKAYLNHEDGWESHYSWGDEFKANRPWRKRQTNGPDGGLATLEVSSWPERWGSGPDLPTFGGKTCKAVIVPDPQQ